MSVITLSVNDSTRGSVTGSGTYTDGTQVTVTATANSGYLFAYWSDGSRVVSSNATYTFTASGTVSLTAYFYNEVDGVPIYGLCLANCKHRILSIGQTIALIQEMAANGFQVPDNFIPKTAVNEIIEQNNGRAIRLFFGTQSEYNKWNGDKTDLLFVPTDDNTLEVINENLSKLNTNLSELKTDLSKGTFVVQSSKNAEDALRSISSSNALRVNGIQFSTDIDGRIVIWIDYSRGTHFVIPQKKLLWSGNIKSKYGDFAKEIPLSEEINIGDTLEICYAISSGWKKYIKFEIKRIESSPTLDKYIQILDGYYNNTSDTTNVYGGAINAKNNYTLEFRYFGDVADGQEAGFTLYSVYKVIE